MRLPVDNEVQVGSGGSHVDGLKPEKVLINVFRVSSVGPWVECLAISDSVGSICGSSYRGREVSFAKE